MPGERSFVCLRCGKTVKVSAEKYRLIREEPICDECKCKKPQETETNEPQGVLNTAFQIAQKAANIISKTISSEQSEASSDTDKKHSTSVLNNILNTATTVLNGIGNNLPTDESVFKKADWQHIGCLGELYDNDKLSEWRNYVGLYMHKIDGKIMYIGRAVEYNNGGFRKRLSDYCRANGSARKHPSGQKIYANRYRIQTHILIVGSDAAAAEKTKRLEEIYVGKYNPPWNSKLKTND